MEGAWTALYAGVSHPRPYGDSVTYRLGAAFLGDLAVEDWGCGLGWFRRYAIGPYRGVDGSRSPFADTLADLAAYRSSVPGLFMRHVLEHNRSWQLILDNALASFRHRMVLVVFTPFGERTRVISEFDYGPGALIPEISFARDDLVGRFSEILAYEDSVETSSWYGREHIFYLEKPHH
jgi:hypothetical protein